MFANVSRIELRFALASVGILSAAIAWLTAVEGGKDRETGTFFAWPARKHGIRQV